jgi:hypothetical protein
MTMELKGAKRGTNSPMLDVVSRVLTRAGYEVLPANGGIRRSKSLAMIPPSTLSYRTWRCLKCRARN